MRSVASRLFAIMAVVSVASCGNEKVEKEAKPPVVSAPVAPSIEKVERPKEPEGPSAKELLESANALTGILSWKDKRAQYENIVATFPDDPIAKEAALGIKKLDQQRDLQEVHSSMDPDVVIKHANRDAVPPMIEKMKESMAECPTCIYADFLKRQIELFENLLETWPKETVPNIDRLMLGYADYRGKEVAIWGEGRKSKSISVQATDYYNCKFKSQSKWRSFATESKGTMHLYCRKGQDDCEALFLAAMDSPVEIVDARVKYPRKNKVCEQSQLELMSYIKPKVWAGLTWQSEW